MCHMTNSACQDAMLYINIQLQMEEKLTQLMLYSLIFMWHQLKDFYTANQLEITICITLNTVLTKVNSFNIYCNL